MTCFPVFALSSISIAAIASSARAQPNEINPPDSASTPALTQIVVTAVPHAQNELDSSISVSTLDAAAIAQSAPRSVAELLRGLPGIRAEYSGGEGNANIQSRGIPISTGGAKFLQLQEDGLPVLDFGDIAFGNTDIFIRADFNIARVESVRGGSASTFASNAPGGVINFISRTGATQGGVVQATAGIDYGEYRVDASYGAKIARDLSLHVGGFYRVGEGPRRAGYDGNRGGQVRGNISKNFGSGFVRLHFKYLNDRAIAYLPAPVRVTGTDNHPNYRALPGLSPNKDTIHSVYFTRAVTLDGKNNRAVDDIRDGMHPLVKAVGFEAQFDVAGGWTINNKFRYADISGRFISPFPASADTAQNLGNSIGGAGSTVTYANGPRAGQAVAPGSTAIGIVLFNTRLNSLDHVVNDVKFGRKFAVGTDSSLEFSAGFYTSRQKIDIDWTWSSYLLAAQGDNAALLNVTNAAGNTVTDGGLVAYGAYFFGNCCRRAYHLTFDTSAPYAQASFHIGGLTIDGSTRYDLGKAKGHVAGDGPVVSFDVDGNGTVSTPEQHSTTMPLGAPRPVKYSYHYWSYSVGANYRLRNDLALFGRYSRGGRANADRFVFSGNTNSASGALLPGARPVDFVTQAEAGVKYLAHGVGLYGTAFHARTGEQNYEATTQTSFANTYRAYGVELEGSYRTGGFNLTANGTWTHARIVKSRTQANIGHRPRRQAAFIYRVNPSYKAGMFAVGTSVIGTTSSYTQDSNQLKLPAFTQVNAFASIKPIPRLQISVHANNLFNVTGFTEAEEATIPASGIVRARSINGRSVSLSVRMEY